MYYNRMRKTRTSGVDMDTVYEAAVIGGGAAGLMCAHRLAARGVRGVILLEGNDRLGRKLSVTGNGQGNVTNTHMSAAHYFGSGGEQVAAVLEKYGEEWLIGELASLGGMFAADAAGRVYPTSRQAASVTDLFRFALAGSGTEIRLGERAVSAEKSGNVFCVRTARGSVHCRALVLACGGKASPHLGSDGNGYAIAASFGHTVTPLSPSLVRLRTDAAAVRGLKGIRCDCTVTLIRPDGKKGAVFSDTATRGDVLFTDGGVSGDAVFRISAFVKPGDAIAINFLPDCGAADVVAALCAKAARYPKMRAEDLLRGIVHSAVGRAALRRCNVAADEPAEAAAQKLPSLAGVLQWYTVAVTGTDGFANAQVTKGGADMRELTACLESKKVKGLYFAGELCDVDGECGGYNLQWAFSSGACVADAIADSVCE